MYYKCCICGEAANMYYGTRDFCQIHFPDLQTQKILEFIENFCIADGHRCKNNFDVDIEIAYVSCDECKAVRNKMESYALGLKEN